MKNIYSILSLFLVLMTVSVFGQSKIYAPSLSAPENMETVQMPDVLLDWNAVTGVALEIMYELQLADNMEFTGAVTFNKTDLTAMSMMDLVFGHTYYWRVRAYDNDVASDWSEPWNFTVAFNVELKTPSDGSEEYSNPIITWTPMTGIDGYEMQLDTVFDWNMEESGISSDIYGTSIIADNDIWAVGKSGVVLHYDGLAWTVIDVGTTENLNAISFIDASNGYIVGDAGVVLYYDGATWTVVEAGVTTNLLGASFISADNGVVVGEGGSVLTYNTGIWEYVSSGTSEDLYDVQMLSTTNIWACGLGKIVVNYDGVTWSSNEVGEKDHYAIAMIDANNGWTVGKSGKIYRWNGAEWYEEDTPTNKDLSGISFNGMIGYAVGKSGTMIKFDGSWTSVPSGVSDYLYGVDIADNSGLAVGAGGTMIMKSGTGFNSPYLTVFEIPMDSSSWGLHNLLFGQKFYYRMRTFHGADTSDWSGTKSIETYASPELDAPASGTINDLLIRFEWDEYEGSSNYIFELDDDETFASPRSFAPDDDTLWVNDLVYGTEYFWRVAAQHSLDISDWSEVWSFTTVNQITLVSPENSAIGVSKCPLFTWDEVVGSSDYELWVDVDESFDNPNVNIGEEPHYQCQSTMEVNTMYYWKVRGISGALVSEWSETWSFTTEGGIGIEESISAKNTTIYPNPGNGLFNISINSTSTSDYKVKVIDISGKEVYETVISCQAGSNTIPVSINNIGSGTYNLIIADGENLITKKLVIK